MKQHNSLILLAALALVLITPSSVLAGGITEIAGPLQQVVDTLKGPMAKLLCVVMMIVCAVGYWFSRGEEISGVWKTLIGVVFLMTLIAFATPIIDKLFSFSGAVL